MNFIDFLKDKLLLFLLHLTCMLLLSLFLYTTDYSMDCVLIILTFWLLILFIWTLTEYFRRKQYFHQIEFVMEQIDQRFLLGELMPDSYRLEDRLYRELIRRSNKSVIERIHQIEDQQKDYREYIESWVHEIKAPITAISLTCENHKDSITRQISLENQKIENYVDMALYYARSDEVYKDYVIQDTDLQTTAEEIAVKNKYYLIQNGIQLEIHCPHRVYTDKKWIAFILNQLILNSTKYRRESDAWIRIFTCESAHGIILTVQDNGIGIRENELSRIFEKGFTGTNGRICGRSTGMGLYLCQKLCLKLGIRIDARSREQEGTEIFLEFAVSTYLSKL